MPLSILTSTGVLFHLLIQNKVLAFPVLSHLNTYLFELEFHALRLIIKEWERQGNKKEVDKSHFLEMISKNPLLKHLFVEYYSSSMEFYVFQFTDDCNEDWYLYSLFDKKDLKFAFNKKTQ